MPNQLNQMLRDQYERSLGTLSDVVVIDFSKLDSEKTAVFRRKVREAKLTMEVVKNRIAVHALKDRGLKPLMEHDQKAPKEKKLLRGMSALLFGGDGTVDVAKFTKGWLAENKDSIVVRGGQMGSDILTPEQVEQAATLPGRKELLSQMAGGFLAMPQKVAAMFQQGYAQVLYAFKALEEKLEKAEGGEAPKA